MALATIIWWMWLRRLALTTILVAVGLAVSASMVQAAGPAWTTYRHDALRSGVDPDSTSPLSPAQTWQTVALDGNVYGQPLVYGSRVFVATENDTVYALDAATGAVIWQRHLATAVPAGKLPCGDIAPTVGITSTPVIDPATGAIYVVADAWDGSNLTSVHHELFGLTLADGATTPGLPVVVDPPGTTPTAQLQRPALALDAGKVIIGFGGNAGDCGSYHGWLAAMPEIGGALQTFEVDPGGSGGAVWAAGNGPPVDGSGDIWASTGNGFGSGFGHQESVLKLDPDLNLLDFWAPADWQTLDQSDIDLGSSAPVLLPGGLLFQIGKQGVGDLLSTVSTSGLGGEGGPPVFEASVCSGSWGGGIYYNGVIYVTCSDGLHALALNTTARTFTPLASWTVNGNAAGPPIEAGGLVWSADYNGTDLYGLNPHTGATSFAANLGGFVHFASPSAGGGRLFVANRAQVTAFTIAQPPSPSPTSTALTTSSSPAAPGQTVAYTATVSPAPDAGTVSFTDDGAPVAGCTSVGLEPASGRAGCTLTYGQAGTHTIRASYSGDAYYSASSSSPLSEVVAPGAGATSSAPRVSGVRVTVRRGRVWLGVVLSERARIAITVSRLAAGRRVGGRCRTRAHTGRHCLAQVKLRRLTVTGRSGHDRFRLRMRRLRPGRYRLSMIATNAAGQHSRRVSVSFKVRPARR